MGTDVGVGIVISKPGVLHVNHQDCDVISWYIPLPIHEGYRRLSQWGVLARRFAQELEIA